MRSFRIRYSLPTLLLITAVLAVVSAFAATHFRIVIGGIIAALWVLDFAGGPMGNFFDAWPELRGPKRTPSRNKAKTDSEKTNG